jgi:hypothetical protein
MRLFLLALVPASLLAGCRGYIADHLRPEASIMGPELTRYGLAAEQSQCVGGRLVGSLTVWQLRQLANVTRLIKDPARLNPRDLVWVSTHVKDPQVPLEVRRAAEGCGLNAATTASAAAAAAPPPDAAPPPAAPPAEPPASSPAQPSVAPSAGPALSAAPAPAPGTWLNLGSGVDKRAISIDASTLEGEKPLRTAWFRIVAAGAAGTVNSYRLQIDCSAKTVNPLASRKHDSKGAVTEEVIHGETGAGANPIQGGSVIEIAYLSLCT